MIFQNDKDLKVSFIVPCKNEENNIRTSRMKLEKTINHEYLFGDDNTSDQTSSEIDELSKKLNNNNIIKYTGVLVFVNLIMSIKV